MYSLKYLYPITRGVNDANFRKGGRSKKNKNKNRNRTRRR
jgi:hypothetical protein